MGFHIGDEREWAEGSSTEKQITSNKSKRESPVRCSLCGKEFFRSESGAFPFCTERCRKIDLGNWLNESYGLPIEDSEVFEEDED